MLLLKTISVYQMNLLLLIHNMRQRNGLLRELISFSSLQLRKSWGKEENVESFGSGQVELQSGGIISGQELQWTRNGKKTSECLKVVFSSCVMNFVHISRKDNCYAITNWCRETSRNHFILSVRWGAVEENSKCIWCLKIFCLHCSKASHVCYIHIPRAKVYQAPHHRGGCSRKS